MGSHLFGPVEHRPICLTNLRRLRAAASAASSSTRAGSNSIGARECYGRCPDPPWRAFYNSSAGAFSARPSPTASSRSRCCRSPSRSCTGSTSPTRPSPISFLPGGRALGSTELLREGGLPHHLHHRRFDDGPLARLREALEEDRQADLDLARRRKAQMEQRR